MAKLDVSQIDQEPRHLGTLGRRIYKFAGLVGIGALAVSLILSLVLPEDRHGFWRAYLTNFCYFLSLSLGALFFVILQHLTRAGWSVVLRRLAELLAANLVWMGLLFVPVLVSAPALYEWAHGGEEGALASKHGYLNLPFFVLRCVAYFLIWGWLARSLLSRSLGQDATGDAGITLRMVRRSGVGIVLFTLTVTFASFDLIMSIDPHWYSTIFGVYFFAGCVCAFLSILIVLGMLLQWSGRLSRAITVEHYHDLGKLLFGFIFFWGYIAFSQYMLIWYANIPEETAWYLSRQTGGWTWVSLALLFGRFALPFVGLLSRRAKRSRPVLAFWAVWVLVLHWVDLFWLIAPGHGNVQVLDLVLGLGCLVGLGGLFVAGFVALAGDYSLVPLKDPRLAESLSFENA